MPVRVNPYQDTEYMSWNNRDCLWGLTRDGCDEALKKAATPAKPLTCGEMHLS